MERERKTGRSGWSGLAKLTSLEKYNIWCVRAPIVRSYTNLELALKRSLTSLSTNPSTFAKHLVFSKAHMVDRAHDMFLNSSIASASSNPFDEMARFGGTYNPTA
jgi:hypothetical protein